MKYTTRQVRKMIHRYLVEENGLNSDTPEREFHYHSLVADCRYAIIENYVPECPGWCGDVLFVVFGISESYMAFYIDNETVQKIEQDGGSFCEHCATCPLVGYEVRKKINQPVFN